MKQVCIMLFIILLFAGCGKKGQLVAPEALAPAPIADLRVEQRGEQFVVSWSRPGAAEGGGALKNLAGFQVFKREVLPPGEDCEECPTAYRLVINVDLEYPKGVMVAGNRYFFSDGDLADGKTYRYKVLSVQKGGTTTSRTSNQAGKKKVSPPLPPVLKAVSSLEGVVLEWGGVPPPANGRIEGYTIYRKQSGEKSYFTPLNGTPVRETTFADKRLEWGRRYDYVVRTVAVIDGEAVESVPSNEVPGALVEPE